MKKGKIRKLAIALLLPLAVGLCGTAEAAQAKGTELGSRGNIIYQNGGEKAEVYAADFLLLKEKLDTMPNEIFSPAYYAHVHQWVQEAAHVLVFEQVDANCHRSRCVLDEEGYCLGYEPILEEHYAYYYIPDSDGEHHRRICFDCGYQVEETCSFTLESWEKETEIQTDESVRYCECGNRRQTEGGETKEPDTDITEKPGEETEGSISENSISGNSVSENTIITEKEVKDNI